MLRADLLPETHQCIDFCIQVVTQVIRTLLDTVENGRVQQRLDAYIIAQLVLQTLEALVTQPP
ncbi:hypothetical protein D3C87_1946650 [compost metagenome]